ncbi:transcription termination/antitermination protein NusG [Litorivivens sp.]|uniref:transcription termination/antitermination protein NusG n=2 Tax=Litorivivens sp. TaxID=2020868 RepID=UPI003566CB2A
MSVHNHSGNNFYLDDSCTGLNEQGETDACWHVIWTRSNCERMVSDLLGAKGYNVFLPLIEEWSTKPKSRKACNKPNAVKATISSPMFKGYLFVKHRIDRASFLEISNTKGVAHILGTRWNALASIPEDEIASIRCMVESHLPLMPHPYLEIGSKVVIKHGALANAQGILIKTDSEKGLFVVSVPLLKSSVAVNVDFDDLVPV